MMEETAKNVDLKMDEEARILGNSQDVTAAALIFIDKKMDEEFSIFW